MPNLLEFLEGMEFEGAFCIYLNMQRSPTFAPGRAEIIGNVRKKFLGRYLVEREAFNQGVSISRRRAEQKAAKRTVKRKGPQGVL